jgi:hypothetical protein
MRAPADNPGDRAGGAMVYDAATGNVVLFGGYLQTPRCNTSSMEALQQTWTWG